MLLHASANFLPSIPIIHIYKRGYNMRRKQDVLPTTPERGKRLYQETQAALVASRSPFAAEPAYEARKARRETRVLKGYYSLTPVNLTETKAFKAAVEDHEREKENSVTRGIGKLGINT
jgi:hypothetical protein